MEMMRVDACTLPDIERPLRLAEFDTLFAEAVVGVELADVEARLTLSGAADLRDRVLDLTRRESKCCSFFDFTVGEDDVELEFVIRVPPAQHDVLVALTDRAARLSS